MMKIGRRGLLKGGAAALATWAVARPAFAQGEPIRIGFIAPLSGFQQLIGEQLIGGARIGVATINEAGGVLGRPLELVVRDDKGDANEAAAIMRELASNGVNITMGTPLTAMAMAAAALVPNLGGVHLIAGSVDPRFSHELFNRHIFTIAHNSIQRSRLIARVMAERYPDVTVWGAKLPDIAVGHDTYAIFEKALREDYKAMHGVDIVMHDPVLSAFGTSDFRPQLAQLLAQPIQGLFGMEIGSDGITFYKQARQFRLWDKVQVLAENSLEITMGKTLGQESPPEAWSPTHWYKSAFPEVEASQNLVRRFEAETGDSEPSGIVSLGDTAVRAFAAAITHAQSTETAAVIDALETVTFEMVNGPASFRPEDHAILNDAVAIKIAPNDTAPFWSVPETIRIAGTELLSAPVPGTPFEL